MIRTINKAIILIYLLFGQFSQELDNTRIVGMATIGEKIATVRKNNIRRLEFIFNISFEDWGKKLFSPVVLIKTKSNRRGNHASGIY